MMKSRFLTLAVSALFAATAVCPAFADDAAPATDSQPAVTATDAQNAAPDAMKVDEGTVEPAGEPGAADGAAPAEGAAKP